MPRFILKAAPDRDAYEAVRRAAMERVAVERSVHYAGAWAVICPCCDHSDFWPTRTFRQWCHAATFADRHARTHRKDQP